MAFLARNRRGFAFPRLAVVAVVLFVVFLSTADLCQCFQPLSMALQTPAEAGAEVFLSTSNSFLSSGEQSGNGEAASSSSISADDFFGFLQHICPAGTLDQITAETLGAAREDVCCDLWQESAPDHILRYCGDAIFTATGKGHFNCESTVPSYPFVCCAAMESTASDVTPNGRSCAPPDSGDSTSGRLTVSLLPIAAGIVAFLHN